MIDNRVESGLGKYTLINRAFLSISVVAFFLSLVQDTCQVLCHVTRQRVTPVLA